MRVLPIAVLSLAAAACAPAGAPRSSTASRTGTDQCFSARLVNSFRPVGRDAVDVEIGSRRIYRLGLGAGCFDVDWASSVALRSRSGGFICNAGDAELIVPAFGGAERCTVTSINRLSEAEIDAARRN